MVTQVVSTPSFHKVMEIDSTPVAHPEYDWIADVFQKQLHLSPLHVDPISQGWTNRNFKVVTEKGTYFFRLGTDHASVLGISREKEAYFYSLVRSLEITPDPLYLDPSVGILVTPFIEEARSFGKVLGTWTGDREEVIDKVAELMKTIHTRKPMQNITIEYPFAIIEKYFSECQNARASLPSNVEQALAIAAKMKHFPLRYDHPVLCHHDFFWENLLFDGRKLWIVDWEYADWDDPFYDLAGFCIAHRVLDEEEQNILLKAYFSTYGKEDQKKLTAMCMLYSLKNALWAYLQIALCPQIPYLIHSIADMHYETFWSFYQRFDFDPSLSP
jgi:thiamine kinase-like enzyme